MTELDGPLEIDPYNRWVGSFVPEWLEGSTKVGPGEKLCYARLMRFAGKDGNCFPSQGALADALGVSISQVGRYVKKLKEVGLIKAKQRGLGMSNTYVFLEHPMMNGAKEKGGGTTLVQGGDRNQQKCGDRTRISDGLDQSDLRDIRESSKRTIERESREENNLLHERGIEVESWIDSEEVREGASTPLTSARSLLEALCKEDGEFKHLLSLLDSGSPLSDSSHNRLIYSELLDQFLRHLNIRGEGSKFWDEKQVIFRAVDKWVEVAAMVERHAL